MPRLRRTATGIFVMPRRGMGVEMRYASADNHHGSVMPRRGMGVEIRRYPWKSLRCIVMPRRGMGVEIDGSMHVFVDLASCPAGAWE